MLVKLALIVMLLIILSTLGSGLYYLMNHQSDTQKTVKMLTFRIALSLLLFVILMLSFGFGLITPHGVV